jgi:hypothetical protein
VAAGAALLLLISTFVEWFTASVKAGGFGVSASQSGWDSGTIGKLVALLALVALVIVALELFARHVTLPYPSSLILVAIGGLATLLVIIKFLDKPGTGGITGVSIGYGWGIFLALIAAIGIAVGGYLKLQET